ncbi:MAG: sigma-70 family RNA polymerase sigma factor [Planctomycetota bacterium]
MVATRDEITRLLGQASAGDQQAAGDLMPLVYDELRSLADAYLRQERSDHTLQPTALVHEAYLRLVDQTRVEWQDRTHFFAIAATSMRRILINHARDRNRLKRGGGARRITLGELSSNAPMTDEALLELDEALSRLAALDARKASVVEHRYFAGLSIDQTAELLGTSPATVKRDWEFARAWLLQELTGGDEGAGGG